MSNGSPWTLSFSSSSLPTDYSQQQPFNPTGEVLSPLHHAAKAQNSSYRFQQQLQPQRQLPPQAPWEFPSSSSSPTAATIPSNDDASERQATFPTILDGTSGSFVSMENPRKYLSRGAMLSPGVTPLGGPNAVTSPKRNCFFTPKRSSNLTLGTSFSTPSLPPFSPTQSQQAQTQLQTQSQLTQQAPITSHMTSSNNSGNGNLYKTELCRSFMETGKCRYGSKCMFAHGQEELRSVQRHPRYRTEICKSFHILGKCRYGTRCKFIHLKPGESLPPGCTLVDNTPPVSHRSSSMASLIDDTTPVNQLIPEKVFDLVLNDNPLLDTTSLSGSVSYSGSFSELPTSTSAAAVPPPPPTAAATAVPVNFNSTSNSPILLPQIQTSPKQQLLQLQRQQVSHGHHHHNHHLQSHLFMQSQPLLDFNGSLSPTTGTHQQSPLPTQQQQQQQQQLQHSSKRLQLSSASQPSSSSTSPTMSPSTSSPLLSSDSFPQAQQTQQTQQQQQQQQRQQGIRQLHIVRSKSGIYGNRGGGVMHSSLAKYDLGGCSSASSSMSNLVMVPPISIGDGSSGNGSGNSFTQPKSASYSKLPGFN